MCVLSTHTHTHLHSHKLSHTHTCSKGIHSFHGFLLAHRCHPFRYPLIKLVNWLSYCWTHRGSQLFVSLSQIQLAASSLYSVCSVCSKVTRGFALSERQIGFAFFPRTCSQLKSTILPLSLTNGRRVIILGDRSARVIMKLMFVDLVGVAVISLIYCQSCNDKLRFRSLWLNWKTTTIFHTQFPPNKLATGRWGGWGEEKKKYMRAETLSGVRRPSASNLSSSTVYLIP